MSRSQFGFTLIEILVALVILAIIGGMMVVGLQSAIRTQNHITVKAEKLASAQSAIIIIERDVEQIINRPIIDTNGSGLPAVVLTQKNNLQTFEFTHAGYINPFAMSQRATLQRVSYGLEGDKLIRTIWPVLDRTPDTKPSYDTLLTGVHAFQVTLYYAVTGENGGTNNVTTPLQTAQQTPVAPAQLSVSNLQSIPIPVAVELVLEVEGIGSITRFITLAG